MLDHNIFNRATFDDKQIRHKVLLQPFIYESGNSLDLGQGAVYWVRHVTWKFGYFDVGAPNARIVQAKAPEVWVSDILDGYTTPLNRPFSQPKPLLDKIDFRVKNNTLSNNMQLQVEFELTGVLVKPKDGAAPIGLKEQLGWVMLSDEKRGEMAMAEAAIDAIEQKMTGMGMDSIRSKLPSGMGLSAISALPEPLQAILLNGAIPELTNQFKSLAGGPASHLETLKLAMDADPQKEKSAFMGDLMSGCPAGCQLTKEQLQAISEFMIQNGWRKI